MSAAVTAVVSSSLRKRRTTGERRAGLIPDDVLSDPDLNRAIATLPHNYEFELHKTVWRLRQSKASCVALQFPEGLLMYACVIADILERFCAVETLVMGDVTYGACCVDDFAARAAGADFLVHYGHSCLVPIDVSSMNMLYVFVDIKFDIDHLLSTLRHNLGTERRVVVASTIQFASSLHAVKAGLRGYFGDVFVPQGKPLSPGEVLGCTSPVFDADAFDTLIFIADGRFHMESIMIQNPHIGAFFKYDPYNKKLTREKYDHARMHQLRRDAIHSAASATKFGLILGTLGRQGNPNILKRLRKLLVKHNRSYVIVLLSEIFPSKLKLFVDIDAWVQVACPRLSIDWGYAFEKPLLTGYELEVALDETQWKCVYPMDYYRLDGGRWSNYYEDAETRARKAEERAAARAQRAEARRRRMAKRKIAKSKKNRAKDHANVSDGANDNAANDNAANDNAANDNAANDNGAVPVLIAYDN